MLNAGKAHGPSHTIEIRVRFDDLLTLRTCVARVEKNGVTFGFSLFRTEAGKDILAAEGKVSCRAIDATWKTIPLPPELKSVL